MTETSRKQVPAIEGWFTFPSDEPHLIGTRCKSCGDYFFPPSLICRNPNCTKKTDLEKVQLSRRGKLWSYTINYFKPPMPYRSPDPFVPYAIAVVELDKEKMKVQGQVASDCDFNTLKVGMDMELVLEKLYEDEQGNDVMVWKFKTV